MAAASALAFVIVMLAVITLIVFTLAVNAKAAHQEHRRRLGYLRLKDRLRHLAAAVRQFQDSVDCAFASERAELKSIQASITENARMILDSSAGNAVAIEDLEFLITKALNLINSGRQSADAQHSELRALISDDGLDDLVTQIAAAISLENYTNDTVEDDMSSFAAKVGPILGVSSAAAADIADGVYSAVAKGFTMRDALYSSLPRDSTVAAKLSARRAASKEDKARRDAGVVTTLTALKEDASQTFRKLAQLEASQMESRMASLDATHALQVSTDASFERQRQQTSDGLLALGGGVSDTAIAVRSDVGAVASSLGLIKGDLGSVKGDLGSAMGDLSSVKGDLSSVKGDMGSVKGDLISVKGDMGSVKGDLSSVKGDLSSVTSGFSTTDSNLLSVRNDLSSMKAALDAVKAALALPLNAGVSSPTNSPAAPPSSLEMWASPEDGVKYVFTPSKTLYMGSGVSAGKDDCKQVCEADAACGMYSFYNPVFGYSRCLLGGAAPINRVSDPRSYSQAKN